MNKIKKNIPNMITISRIISSVAAPISLLTGNGAISIILYIYGAISDFLDGLAARKLNAFTELGRKLDPISDKLYALSLLASSLILGNYLMLIPLVLEGEITATTIAAKKSNISIETERVGKYKTWLLSASLILGILAPIFPVMYFPLAASLIGTTHFQIQSIHAYERQYLDKLNNKEEKKFNLEQTAEPTEAVQDKTSLKKIQNQITKHYNEFVFYQNVPIESPLKNNPKVKKKVKEKRPKNQWVILIFNNTCCIIHIKKEGIIW